MESNELSIVIVTYKSEEIISTCLDSIPKNLQIFVVENSNNKDFKNKLESNYSNVKCILTGSNKGYAVANNIGLNIGSQVKKQTCIANSLCIPQTVACQLGVLAVNLYIGRGASTLSVS